MEVAEKIFQEILKNPLTNARAFAIIQSQRENKEEKKMKLFKKRENKKIYKIAFCDTCDISTKFGEEHVDYPTYEAAKNAIFSHNAGWGKAIKEYNGDSARIDGAWLIIFEKST